MSLINLSLNTCFSPESPPDRSRSVPIPPIGPDPSRSFPTDSQNWILRNCCKFQICNRQFCETLTNFKSAIVNFAKLLQISNLQSWVLRNSSSFQMWNREFHEKIPHISYIPSIYRSYYTHLQPNCYFKKFLQFIIQRFACFELRKSKTNLLSKRSDLEWFLCVFCGSGFESKFLQIWRFANPKRICYKNVAIWNDFCGYPVDPVLNPIYW